MSDTPRTDARAFSGGWYKRMDPDGRGYAKTELHLVDAEVARTLERELAAVTAERDALRQDAERYRWLRERINYTDAPPRSVGQLTVCAERRWTHVTHNMDSDTIDQTIDTALRRP